MHTHTTHALIHYVHRIAPSDKDVVGPFTVLATDFADMAGIRRWLKRNGQSPVGRAVFRVEGDRVLVFPSGRNIWHSLIITFVTRVVDPNEPVWKTVPEHRDHRAPADPPSHVRLKTRTG
jgi:hypothetical protein